MCVLQAIKCVRMPRNEAVCFACTVVAYERQSVDQTSTMKCVLSSSVVIYLILKVADTPLR